MYDYDIIVIGGGPAGMTAALYAARAGKKTLILESNAFGGQIATSPRVENYPFVKRITGAELADGMFSQIADLGVDFDMGSAVCEKREDGFVVTTEYGKYLCRAVVLATGVRHKKLNLQREEELTGKGVCYCAVCDGAFYAGKSVAVVGDGNSAAQYCLYLAETCEKVYLCTLTDKLFCDKNLCAALQRADKVQWIKSVSVTALEGTDELSAIRFSDGSTLPVDALFVAIGQQPHNEAFAGLVKLDEQGYVVAGEDCATSCEGVFAAGDCRTKKVRQCATAVGDGATAAVNACAYIDSL